MDKYLLVDNGGTLTKYALAYEDGTILENGEFNAIDRKAEGAVEKYFALLGEVVEKYRKDDIKGICISCPGRIEDSGMVLDAGALPYFIGVNLVEECKKRFDLNASIENDAKCAALAELVSGGLKGCKNGMVITIGTGLGGGVVVNNQLHKGSCYCAGEISVIPMNMFKFYDEKYTSSNLLNTRALINMIGEAVGVDSTNMNGKDAFEYINNGDQRALKALADYGELMGQMIYTIQIILDADCYAIGGGISSQPKLIEAIDAGVEKAFSVPWICEPGGQPAVVRPRVVACKYRNDANLLGALYDFLNKNK